MGSIYIKKLTKQDITRSYSPNTEATRDFFDIDLDNTQEYFDINVCYYGNREFQSGITIHKGYQGEKDWRICGANFKSLYAFRNPEEGDLSIWKRYGKKGNYQFSIQIIKQTDTEYSAYDKLLEKKDNHMLLTIDTDSEDLSVNKPNSNFTPNFTQTIYYGVPGSGKSHKIDEQTKNIPDEQKIRVVFHPEYTNADFVGQILPVVDGDAVKYTFKPGSFTRILVAALKNPEKPYYLIIEEINRGNAAAIFGEIFQLLDRSSDGWSSYCIMNDDINYEIRKTVPELNWTANTGIRLPPNLSLFATMNTSDQNVFTLDNAFQRRWEMELVQNQCNDSSQMDAKITVNNQSITWKNFQTQINSIIGEKSNEGGLSSMEDKRLGCWFIKAEDGVIDEKKFANKVLKYLWDDAFKFCHQEIFESDIKNFEELQKRFFEKGFDVFSENCGLKDFLSTTQPDSESKSETTTPQDSESQSETSEQ